MGKAVLLPPRVSGSADELLQEAVWAARDVEGLSDEERRQRLETALKGAGTRAWQGQLSDECATSTAVLKGLVQARHAGLARLERVNARAEIPAGLPIPSKLEVLGLPVIFADGASGGKLCTNLDPSVLSLLHTVSPNAFNEISPGVWHLETGDGTAASTLLNPATLPKPARTLVAFVPTANHVVLALANRRDAMLAAANAAAQYVEQEVGHAVCVSEEPLVLGSNGWGPWKTSKAIRDTREFRGFASNARQCVVEALRQAVQRLRVHRINAVDQLPEMDFASLVAGELRIDLFNFHPVMVVENPRVRVSRNDDEKVLLEWKRFASVAGTRLTPLMVDGSQIAQVFLLNHGIDDGEFFVEP